MISNDHLGGMHMSAAVFACRMILIYLSCPQQNAGILLIDQNVMKMIS